MPHCSILELYIFKITECLVLCNHPIEAFGNRLLKILNGIRLPINLVNRTDLMLLRFIYFTPAASKLLS